MIRKKNIRLKRILLLSLAAVCMLGTGCGKGAGEPAGSGAAAETAATAETATAAESISGGSGDVPSSSAPSEPETAPPVELSTEGLTPIYASQLKDGVYSITVDSSSTMFQITACELTVKDGAMTAVMTMGGTGYGMVYMGTSEEAAQAAGEVTGDSPSAKSKGQKTDPADPTDPAVPTDPTDPMPKAAGQTSEVRPSCIPYQEAPDGTHTFTVPVEALDKPLACSAFSRKRETWYDRTLIFRSDSLPLDAFAEGSVTTVQDLGLADGTYSVDVTLEGGSGRAKVESPALLKIEKGAATATIVWGSSNYDYMKVDGQRFDPLPNGGNSTFEIPVSAFDRRLSVIADTVAMGAPHEISYTLIFDSSSIREGEPSGVTDSKEASGGADDMGRSGGADDTGRSGDASGSGAESANPSPSETSATPPSAPNTSVPSDSSSSLTGDWGSLKVEGRVPLQYATQFAIEQLEGGYLGITTGDGSQLLVIPEGKDIPESLKKELPEKTSFIRRPVSRIYLAATSAMDLLLSLDGLDQIRMSGTDIGDWYIEEAKDAMKKGDILYTGKYNAPDYERILSEGCDLSIQSTMLYFAPEVKEQLEGLGIPVLVERSSYESHPLGRMEWIRLYGRLLGKEALADRVFDEQLARLKPLLHQPPLGKTVTFFYISPSGSVSVRKASDYMARTIELAGGTYLPRDTGAGDSSQATLNMQMEAFYAEARDADYLIYSGIIYGRLASLDELLEKSPLLKDFKAVKEGHVYCTDKNLFQESMGLGEMILEIHDVLAGKEPAPGQMKYLYPLH